MLPRPRGHSSAPESRLALLPAGETRTNRQIVVGESLAFDATGPDGARRGAERRRGVDAAFARLGLRRQIRERRLGPQSIFGAD